METRAETESAEQAPVARRTVRDATYDFLRRRGLTEVFANPGSTEIPFLSGFPSDLRFVLGLHEGAVVSMASGYAMARRQPSFVLLHTTAGLGNAVNAISSARLNRTALVIAVGQQDRRHLMFEPFLAGRLEGLAGSYPVWTNQPLRAQDVPGALERAYHEATTRRGPAIVVVPMDDWSAPAGEPHEVAAPDRLLRPPAADEASVQALAELIEAAESPAIVAGPGNDTAEGWAALVALAERLGCPVWQEAFTSGPGFPQDHPLFAGGLPHARSALRDTLGGRDLVLAVGAPIFRQYNFQPGPLVIEGTKLALVTEDPDEAHRSPANVAVLGSPALICAALAERLPSRDAPARAPLERPAAPAPPAPGEPLRGGHVLAALAERLPADKILVEEAPSNRPELELRIPAKAPLGFVSAAMGGLGYGLSAAIGLRMGFPDRPVAAVLGDGATIFGIQGLWSAVHYRVGVLFIVMANGGYRVMDALAAAQGTDAAWPAFDRVDLTAIASGFGCEARRIETHDELLAALDEAIPTLANRETPLLLEVVIAP